MKFSPSSSTSFSTNFCTNKGNTLGCFSGFLSRILSLKTQQTYPSEIEREQQLSKIEAVLDGLGTPNVVARLMGLEFMPEISSKDDKNDWKSSFRSKSMDAGENRAETEDVQGIHRRVKTSFSFRETPNFFEVEDDNFFVLSFESNKSKKNKKNQIKEGNKHKKCRKKQRKNREEQSKNRVVFSDEERVSLKISPQNCQGIDNDFDGSKQSYHLYPFKEKISDVKEDENGINSRKKKKKENCLEVMSKSEVECELENYSPVSVLDDSEFVSESEVTVSSYSEEDAKSRGSECDSKEIPSSSNENSNLDERKTQGNEENKVKLLRTNYRKHENIEMLRKISKLAEQELSNSKWKYRRMLHADELEDTCIDFSQQVFDQLIIELVDQFVVML